MRKLLLALFLGLLAMPAMAGSISSLPNATTPLGNIPDFMMMDQGTGCPTLAAPCTTSKVPSLQVGQPVQANCTVAITSPFKYELCWDTSVSNPRPLKQYDGAQWVILGTLDTTTHIWTPTACSTSGVQNTCLGTGSLISCTTCNLNTAVGYNSATSRTTGRAGVYVGWSAGQNDTTGASNTFLGAFAGQGFFYTNIPLTGSGNIAVGEAAAITINGAASWNTTSGYASAFNLTTGSYNTLYGVDAGQSINTQTNNAVFGDNAYLYGEGSYNIAIGSGAADGYAIAGTVTTNSTGSTILMASTTGFTVGDQIFTSETPIGTTILGVNPNVSVSISNPLTGTLAAGSAVFDLPSPYVGSLNVFVGVDAGGSASGTPAHIIAIGQQALRNTSTAGDNAIAIGYQALGGGSPTLYAPDQTVAIGTQAGLNYNGGDSVFIGYQAGEGGAANTGHHDTAVGSFACAFFTGTAADNTCLGYNSGHSITSASNVVVLGSGADDAGNASNYMNLNGIFVTSGTNVPASSTTVFSGSLQFGGTSASFPMLSHTGAELDLTLADNSAYATLKLNGLIFSSAPSGTPSAYACFDAGNHLIASAVAC